MLRDKAKNIESFYRNDGPKKNTAQNNLKHGISKVLYNIRINRANTIND